MSTNKALRGRHCRGVRSCLHAGFSFSFLYDLPFPYSSAMNETRDKSVRKKRVAKKTAWHPRLTWTRLNVTSCQIKTSMHIFRFHPIFDA